MTKNQTEIVKCACGCEQLRPKYDKKRRLRTYIRGHNRRGSSASVETLRKKSDSMRGNKNPNYGKHHSKETRRKISEALKGRSVSEEIRRKISNTSKGIPCSKETRRKLSEANTGSRHPQWRGGISFEPYPPEFNIRLKKTIRERDNYTCKICGCRGVCVHHIDYNKKNSDNQNLVTLCIKCHGTIHRNREKWIEYFREKTTLLRVDGVDVLEGYSFSIEDPESQGRKDTS